MLFLGTSQSGESTTITYLIGHSFEQKFIERQSGESKKNGIGLVKTAIDATTIPKIGSSLLDDLLPQLYEDPSDTPLVYCELEGIGSIVFSRNEIEKIMINLFTPYALIKMDRVKAIALHVQYTGLGLSGGEVLRCTFRLLSAYFSLEELQKEEMDKSICLTVTHAPRFQGGGKEAEEEHRYELEDRVMNSLIIGYKRTLQNIQCAQDESEKQRLEKIKACFKFFLDLSKWKGNVDNIFSKAKLKYNKILFVFPTDEGESREEMKNFFLAAPGIAPASLRPFDTAQAYWLTQSISQFTPTTPQEKALQAIWETHFKFPDSTSVKQSWERALPQQSTDSSGKPTPDGAPRIAGEHSVENPSSPDNRLRKYLKFIPVGMLAIALLLLLYRVVTGKKRDEAKLEHASKEHSASVETEEDLYPTE